MHGTPVSGNSAADAANGISASESDGQLSHDNRLSYYSPTSETDDLMVILIGNCNCYCSGLVTYYLTRFQHEQTSHSGLGKTVVSLPHQLYNWCILELFLLTM